MDKVKWLYLSGIVLIMTIIVFLMEKIYPVIKISIFIVMQLLLPFILAGMIAYLLLPIIIKLQELNLSKMNAIMMIYVIFFGNIALILYKGLPVFIAELQDISMHLPQLAEIYEQMIVSLYESTAFLPEIFHDHLDTFIIEIELAVEKQLEHILTKISHVFDYILLIGMIPVILFYLLKDYDKLKRQTLLIIPYKYRKKSQQLVQAIHDGLGNYIRGQMIISSIVFLLTFIVFQMMNLKYAFVLSLFTGLMNIIPYFGPIIGIAPAVVIALTHSWKLVVLVVLTAVVIQILEGIFFSPYIMGKSVRLHPIVIIFVLLVSAKLGGFIAMLIAIPIVTIIRAIMIEFWPETAMH